MKKTTHLCAALALSIGLPILSSCDSGGDTSASEISLSGTRYDIAEITNNLANVAFFPSSIRSGESLTYDFPMITVDDVEYEAFNLTITAESSGQFIFNDGRYSYVRDGDNTLARVLRTQQVIDEELEEALDGLINIGSSSATGSLAETLLIHPGQIENDLVATTPEQDRIIVNALISLGFVARLNEENNQIEVLLNQSFSMESTSTNDELVTSSQIQGIILVANSWGIVEFLTEGNVNNNNNNNNNDNVEDDDQQFGLGLSQERTEEEREGTFTLQLNSLTEG